MKRQRLPCSLSVAALLALGACGESAPTSTPGPTQATGGAAGQPASGAPSAGAGGAGQGGVSSGGGGAPSTNAGTAPEPEAGAGAATGGEAGSASTSDPLRIYWIDVEGGGATLLVAPNGETVLVDTGFGGDRDAKRIAAVLRDQAHAERVNHLIITHYHVDHVGGAPALAALVPIDHFYDHGPNVEKGSDFDAYVQLAGDARTQVVPGDVLTLGALELLFVTAAGKVIQTPLAGGGPNALCPSNVTKGQDGGAENAQSVGFVARFGNFDFVDLGDLTWAAEQTLMCPTNRLGTADLFQVNHHGMDISNSPQLVHALAPRVAVMNNGASKGGSPATFEVLQSSPGLSDVWALHEVSSNDAAHNAAEALTANPSGPDQAHFIAAVVEASGAYTLTNARNQMSRTYASR